MNQRMSIREQPFEEAAGWLVECQAGSLTAEQREAFDAWLRASPENVAAYLTLIPLWESSARLDPAQQPDVDKLIEWARGTPTNVIRLDAGSAPRPAQDASPRTRSARWRAPTARGFLSGALAAAVAIAIVAGNWWYSQRNVYSTGVGEQRTIALADGSVVEMNAKSKLHIRFSEHERQVELESGQAMFRVFRDRARPFTVLSGDVSVRAVGTQFDVYRKPDDDTTVTVVEGRVEVKTRESRNGSGAASAMLPRDAVQTPATPAHLILSAGEQVSVRPDAQPRAIQMDVSHAIAWTQGRMIFSATPLDEVAREFNRYNARQLVLQSPEIAALRVNGVFSSTDLATLLAFLGEQPGVVIAQTETEVRINYQ